MLRSRGLSKDYTFKSPSGREFVLNVCKAISTETWKPKVDDPDKIAGFVMGAHSHISLGCVVTSIQASPCFNSAYGTIHRYVNTTVLVRDHSPVLAMQDGSPCPQASDQRASSVIRFVCDPHSGEGDVFPLKFLS